MKKQFSWILLFIAISLISCIFGCKEPEIETDTKAPTNVTNLTVTAADGNAVLTWKNPSDADFDGVQVSMSPAEGTLKNAISLEKDVTSFEVIGLENGKEYTFTVKTFDTSNNKSSGVSANVTVADYTAPAEVIELTAIVSNENAVLTWKNPSDTDLAGIQISMNPAAGTLANTISLGKDVTSLNASGLDSGVDYTFTVKTFDTSLNYSEGTSVNAIYVASSYEVGDIILTDGSKVSVNDVTTYTIDENNKPIGVVAMISDINGVPTPKVIGLRYESGLKWARSGTSGYNTKFTNIVCIPSQTGKGAALTATFTGDTEGSDNWSEICAVDPTGTVNAATNYPAFNFANTYGTTAGLTDTDYENGWYVPSIAELCEVYKNKDVIQTSLTKASGFKIGTSSYWSSSQSASYDDRASQVDFYDGYVNHKLTSYKDYNSNVFVLQALTAK